MSGAADHRAEGSDFESATGIVEVMLELEIAEDFAAEGTWGAADVIGRELEGCSAGNQCADLSLFDFVQYAATAKFGGQCNKFASGLVVCHWNVE